MASVRCLVAGDVHGNLSVLITKLTNVNKSQATPFDLLLCSGAFLATPGKPINFSDFKFPIPVYFYGNYDASYGLKIGEVAENLHYLGADGVTVIKGLKVAFQGTRDTVNDSIKSEAAGVDILLTQSWPAKLLKHVTGDVPADIKRFADEKPDSALTSALSHLAPRYHFSAHPTTYFERIPFSTRLGWVCRFLCIAAVDNTTKQKAIYAFGIVPLVNSHDKAALNKAPPLVTVDPFYEPPAKPTERTVKKRVRDDPESLEGNRDCWFCLQNPNCDAYLLLSVGRDLYVALAKGGIVDDHVLITPILHYPSMASMPQPMIDELEAYITQIAKMWNAKGFMTVIFERFTPQTRNSHGQMHLIPVPITKFTSAQVINAFLQEATKFRITFQPVSATGPLTEVITADEYYFLVEVRNAGTRERIVQRIAENMQHPLQFGREVLCRLMNMPNRIDWKQCQLPKGAANQLCADFRKSFKEFDTVMYGPDFPPHKKEGKAQKKDSKE